jgi:hypothetical protein
MEIIISEKRGISARTRTNIKGEGSRSDSATCACHGPSGGTTPTAPSTEPTSLGSGKRRVWGTRSGGRRPSKRNFSLNQLYYRESHRGGAAQFRNNTPFRDTRFNLLSSSPRCGASHAFAGFRATAAYIRTPLHQLVISSDFFAAFGTRAANFRAYGTGTGV